MVTTSTSGPSSALDRPPAWRAALRLAPALAGLGLATLALGALLLERAPLAAKWGAGGFALGVAALGASALASLGVLAREARAWRRGGGAGGLAPLRGAFVCLVAGWVIYVLWLQPYWSLFVLVDVALSLGAFALLWLSAPWSLARLPRRLVRVGDFALFQLALVLVLGELAVAAYGRWSGSQLFDVHLLAARDEVARRRGEPGSIRLGFPHNSRGDYDAEPSAPGRGHPLVVCIGDSFSAGVVPHYAHFTTVAETFLPGLEVYNMGAPAIGPREYLHLLRAEALALEPDLVVIDVFVGNDISQELFPVHEASLARSWFMADELSVVQVARRLRRLEEERARTGAAKVGAGPGAGALPKGKPLGRRALERHLGWLLDPLQEEPTFSVEGFLKTERERVDLLCDPAIDYAPFYARMTEMIEAAGDVPLAVLLIPDEFQVEDALWEQLEPLRAPAAADRDRPQRELAEWFAQRGVPALDLLPALRAVPPMADGRRHVYHLRDTHLNVRGNRVAGEALGAFLGALLGSR